MNWRDQVFPSDPLRRYGGPVLFVLVSFLVTLALWSLVQPLSSPLFLGAIMLSAWWGGFRSGVVATILSGLVIDYFFISPRYQFVGEIDDIIRLTVFVLEGTLLSWLIAGRKIADAEIRESREQLLALSIHQQTLRESEQKRIALEIHDELGQALTGMKLEVHWLKRNCINASDDSLVHDKLGELSEQIDQTISTVRRISTELRPAILDDFGLVAALEWQASEFARKTSIPCAIRTDVSEIDLDPDTSTAVFRIFQESLTNITRHAGASCVEVQIDATDEDCRLIIDDDGVGIGDDGVKLRASLGILGMKERTRLIGGNLQISRGALGGTRIDLVFPNRMRTAQAK